MVIAKLIKLNMSYILWRNMANIMTTKEVAAYLRLHEITICKLAGQGKIPALRIGRVWRFDKDVIDRWITGGQVEPASDQAEGTNDRKTRKKVRR